MLIDIGRGYNKARRKADSPLYVRKEAKLRSDYDPMLPVSDALDLIDGLSEEERLQAELTLSWIYSNIDLMARDASSVDHHVLRKEINSDDKTRIDSSDLYRLIEEPNPYMDKSYLLRWIVSWLNVSRKGAFIYMAPEVGNRNNILELWPIQSSRIRPVSNSNNYLSHYVYTTGGTPASPERKETLIPASHVMWFRYPDIGDMWGSRPPILAALDAANTYRSISESEQKLFSNARGVPLSIVSVSTDVSEPDFQTTRDQIKSDWQDGTNIAVARAGQISIDSVGFNQRDLEAISSKESSKNEIDSVFFGIAYRNININSGEALKEIDRFMKEKTIWPLLVLIKQVLTQQLARRFFSKNYEITFDDIRTADRALTIQEKIINSRTRSVNEMREADGLSPFPDDLFPGFGDLPVPMANNASFVASYYGIGDTGAVDKGRVEAEDKVGNVNALQDPGLTVQDEIKSTNGFFEMAVASSQINELKLMKKVFSKGKSHFNSRFLTPDLEKELNADGDPLGNIDKMIKRLEKEINDPVFI